MGNLSRVVSLSSSSAWFLQPTQRPAALLAVGSERRMRCRSAMGKEVKVWMCSRGLGACHRSPFGAGELSFTCKRDALELFGTDISRRPPEGAASSQQSHLQQDGTDVPPQQLAELLWVCNAPARASPRDLKPDK